MKHLSFALFELVRHASRECRFSCNPAQIPTTQILEVRL